MYDPDKALREILQCALKIRMDADLNLPAEGHVVEELTDLILDLDSWMRSNGITPKRWKNKKKIYVSHWKKKVPGLEPGVFNVTPEHLFHWFDAGHDIMLAHGENGEKPTLLLDEKRGLFKC